MQGLLAQILGQANGPRINQGFANSGRSYNDMLGRYGGQTPPNPTASPMGPLSQITGSHSPQAQAAQTRAPGMFNGLQGLLSNNSNMLMGMGAGILERGLAGGPSGAFQGRQMDQQQSQQRDQQNATVTALRNMRPDMSEEQIQALVSSGNTALLSEALRPPAQPEDRRIMEDANGRQRFVDTGDFVFQDMAGFDPNAEETQEQQRAIATARASAGPAIQLAQEIMSDPNLERATGAYEGALAPQLNPRNYASWLGGGPSPNAAVQGAVNVRADIERLGGQAFMQAREALKGGGQITDYEGQRAEAALANLATTQDPVAFQRELRNFQEHVARGFLLLEGVEPTAQAVEAFINEMTPQGPPDDVQVPSTGGGQQVFNFDEQGNLIQ
jgi:hypothetical protein